MICHKRLSVSAILTMSSIHLPILDLQPYRALETISI